jgi:hypothetical protein
MVVVGREDERRTKGINPSTIRLEATVGHLVLSFNLMTSYPRVEIIQLPLVEGTHILLVVVVEGRWVLKEWEQVVSQVRSGETQA